jgi:hypothetical protein
MLLHNEEKTSFMLITMQLIGGLISELNLFKMSSEVDTMVEPIIPIDSMVP